MNKTWYKEGVVYQIYPRSFKDSNGDGIGDIPGIIEKVPYLKSLGVTILWLSPVYQSPMDDNGYDISNYQAIHPEFGTMEDLRQLIKVLHENQMYLVMDLVINHTSDEHEWFIKSAQGDPYYKDFYHWTKKKNNWSSFFGGSAMEFHPVRQEYYLHLFSKKQPDLNWDNPNVRKEIKKMITFWLEQGVDGFRCDVINLIAKRDHLPNGKRRIALTGREHYLNIPKIHGYLQEINQEVLSKYDCFTVGETVLITPKIALEYISDKPRELDMVFQFEHMAADNYFVKWFMKKFKPINLKKALSKWQRELQGKGWNSLYLENHDQGRSISRFGDTKYHYQSATLLATMLYFQQGTPYVYQGQEIGMTNPRFENLADYQDIETKNIYQTGRKMGLSHRRMMKKIKMMSRDNARTPMQWNKDINAGFSSHTPWLKCNPNYQEINVEASLKDNQSILHFYQRIIALRKQYPVIVYGDYQDLLFKEKHVYAYERNLDEEKILIYCNYQNKPQTIKLSEETQKATILLSNYPENKEPLFQPYEARVYHLQKKK